MYSKGLLGTYDAFRNLWCVIGICPCDLESSQSRSQGHSQGHTPKVVKILRKLSWKLLGCIFQYFACDLELDTQGHT